MDFGDAGITGLDRRAAPVQTRAVQPPPRRGNGLSHVLRIMFRAGRERVFVAQNQQRLGPRVHRANRECLRVQDADGFLRLDYAGDPTHGNEAYGEAVLRKLGASNRTEAVAIAYRQGLV